MYTDNLKKLQDFINAIDKCIQSWSDLKEMGFTDEELAPALNELRRIKTAAQAVKAMEVADGT